MRRAALCLTSFLLAASAMPRAAEAEVRVASLEKPDVSLDLYGWTQPRFTYEAQQDASSFSLPQVRLGLIGGLGKWGRVQTEIDSGTNNFGVGFRLPELLDAYGVLTPYRSRAFGFDITLGRFRVPFSRQNLIQPVGLQLPSMASFVQSQNVAIRQLGAMLAASFLDGRVTLSAGAFNGVLTGLLGLPGLGGPLPSPTGDPWFFYVGRLEVQPFGPAPRFEGDVRPVGQRSRPALSFGASVLENKHDTPAAGPFPATSFHNIAGGVDVGVWFAGASLYGELLYSVVNNEELPQLGGPSKSRSLAWNVQAGYLPPLPFFREHIEIVARIESSNVSREAVSPEPSILETTSFTWSAGMNVFFDRGHLLKMQIFYQGDEFSDAWNDRLTLQATAGF
jgi:hypothetical protein